MANAQPIQQNQTAEHPIFRLFKDMPGQYLIDEFLAHLRTTAEPESFAGIHPGPLDKTEPFRITRTEKSGAVIVTIRNSEDRFYAAIAQVIAAHRTNWPFPEA